MKRLDEIFNLRYGHSLELNRLQQVEPPDGVNFVSRAMRNNGVTARVLTPAPPANAGEISVALGGNGVLSAFVQPEDFVCGRDVMILTAKHSGMSLAEKLWWCRCIWENRHRYSYGRQANRTLGALEMPNTPPAWVLQASVPVLSLSEAVEYGTITGDYENSYDSLVPITEHFRIEYGHALSMNQLTKIEAPAGLNFVSRKARDNGIAGRVLLPAGVTPAPAGTLSVALGAAPLSTHFQSEPYLTGYHVAVLHPRTTMSIGELLWWKVAIEANMYRYSYGRQANRTLSSLMVPGAPPNFVGDFLRERLGATDV